MEFGFCAFYGLERLGNWKILGVQTFCEIGV